MAWLFARGLLVAFAVLTGCAAPAQQASTLAAPPPAPPGHPETAPIRVAPTRPAQLWPFTSLRNTDYISVRDVAARFNLKVAWSKPEAAMTLGDAQGVRFTFEAGQHDFRFDGLRELGVSRSMVAPP